MSFLSRLLGNDHQRAAEQYAGRESASHAAARKRREGHRSSIRRAAEAAEAWEQRDRRHFR